MKNIIAGTAGHIDHGKSALVQALTGIDPDRLEEEKRRGITIDLGFAHLPVTSDIRLGFIDVPGHERFVKNMLAGASGIDLVLFVVAADESIKPQTREHFDICRLLGISRGIVALTKSDLVDSDILELVRMEVEEFVAGSFLEGAPIVPISAVTGSGVEQLRGELIRAAQQADEKDSTRHLRLPLDRVFSIKGFGTVVTGTLISGSVAKDQEVEIHPGGRRTRVRGIEVYGGRADRARAGQRTALNLADVDPTQLSRGMMVTVPGLFDPTSAFDCWLELLRSATPLRQGSPVHLHAGSAEIEAEVRLLDTGPTLRPGTGALARIVLREPAMLLPGDRFIIRKFSPVITIGGGVVLDNAGIRYRNRASGAARLKTLMDAEIPQRIDILVTESKYGMSVSSLVARSGLLAAELESIARKLNLVILREPDLWFINRSSFQSISDTLVEALRKFHRQNPLIPGMQRSDLRSFCLSDAPPFIFDALISAEKRIAVEGDIARLTTHRVALQEDEQKAREAIESAFERAGLAVPPLAEALAASKIELKRSRSILQMLLREKKLIKINDELVFHHTAIGALRDSLASRRAQRFSVPVFKDWTGISRKYAIPLLEYLDREHVTRREGDERVVL